MNKEYLNWVKVIDDFVSRKYHDCKCPNCKQKDIKYVYVGDKNTQIGYVQAWCDECNVGIYCSRVLIPEGAEIISFDDKNNSQLKSIPKYKMIMPL